MVHPGDEKEDIGLPIMKNFGFIPLKKIFATLQKMDFRCNVLLSA
jgi:hypothetical protein